MSNQEFRLRKAKPKLWLSRYGLAIEFILDRKYCNELLLTYVCCEPALSQAEPGA